MIDVSVIIVTYNNANEINTCLNSILGQSGVQYEIVIIDNASTDQTQKQIMQNKKIQVIKNKQNVGFARAINQARNCCSGSYLLLFNPDATFVGADGIQQLVNHSKSGYSIVGPKYLPETEHDIPTGRYPRFPKSNNYFADLPGKIAWIIGACMLIKGELFDRLNGFDEDYFLYGEEVDFCLRARKAGHKIGYSAQALVQHTGSASEKYNSVYSKHLKKYKGLLLFCKKNYPDDIFKSILKREKRKARYRLFRASVYNFFVRFTYGSLRDKSKMDAALAAIKEYEFS